MRYRLVARAIAVAASGAVMASAGSAAGADRREQPENRASKMLRICPGPILVFFEAGEAAISASAAGLLDLAVVAIDDCGALRLDISGHTDRSGDADSNLTLSRRRADAVRDYLLRAGIPANRLRSAALGERCVMVPTRDGVSEAQNRRVEIHPVWGDTGPFNINACAEPPAH